MKRDELNDLAAFVAVADAGSFTRAAGQLGMSPSALSHAIRGLESRLGLRLLARTTRSVAPTEAGERLLKTLRPSFEAIATELGALGQLRDTPTGSVRVTSVRQAAVSILGPALPEFLRRYPDIRVEINVDERFIDIVEQRFDAGIRFGESVEKDMVAVRIGPDLRGAVVASPAYLAAHGTPKTPQALTAHRCINYRLATSQSLYHWEFAHKGRPLRVKVDGPLVCNDNELMVQAAVDGLGIACAVEDLAAEHLASGRLVRLLQAYCPSFPGFYLYYPGHRQTPPALAALVDALRYRPA
ncbi:LysR family transcriptional regulator [Pseudomonas putida]